MKNLVRSTLACLVLIGIAPVRAQAALQVFACEPEWAALAGEIGGDHIEAYAATTARQDPHHIRAKPSLIAAIRRADLVICSGAGLEVGWLPILLQKAGHPNVQAGSSGYLLAASAVPMLERPVRIDRSEGDIHPEGNPHVHMNPHNIALVAAALRERLKALDPADAGAYQARYDAFAGRWQQATARWESEAAPLRGVPLVVHHRAFSYLLDWLGMQEAATLEAKPGIPPTTAHLESLLQNMQVSPARMIIRTPYDPDDASKWLEQKTGIPAIELPYTVGGDPQAGDLFSLFDRTLALLKEAHHGQ